MTELQAFEAFCKRAGHYNALECINNFRLYQASIAQKTKLEKDAD